MKNAHPIVLATIVSTMKLLVLSLSIFAISINAQAVPIPVGLVEGDTYQLAFVTSTTRDATSNNIDDYNDFVTAAAANNSDLDGLTWRAMASAGGIHARDNALVEATVYRMDGEIIATGHNNMWGSSLLNTLDLDENGIKYVSGGSNRWVWTGSFNNGYQASGYGLGGLCNKVGCRSSFGSSGDVSSTLYNGLYTQNTLYGLYALSNVITVGPSTVPTPPAVLVFAFGLLIFRLVKHQRQRA